MKTRIRYGEARVEVYREKTWVVLYSLFLAVCCMAFGAVFFLLGKSGRTFYFFSIFFLVAGIAVLVLLPEYYGRMNREYGAVLMSADREGISLSPLLNMKAVRHAWQDIERIALTRKFVTRQHSEKGYDWNQAVVFFRKGTGEPDLLERSRSQIWKTPSGLDATKVPIPKEEMNRLAETLESFSSGRVEASVFGRVEFDYMKISEIFEP